MFKNTHTPKGSIERQNGATLIESMISLFVFSIGVLGIAAIQTTSMVRVDDIKQRSVAVWKAQELVDRMRATKTMDDPNGLLEEYFLEINNTNADKGIGRIDDGDRFATRCEAPDKRCDDLSGTAGGVCTPDEYVEFDLWSVMCDANSGVAVADGFGDGNVGLRDLELSMDRSGVGYRVYFEWVSRSADNDVAIREGAKVKTVLCGEELDIDPRLDAYCITVQ